MSEKFTAWREVDGFLFGFMAGYAGEAEYPVSNGLIVPTNLAIPSTIDDAILFLNALRKAQEFADTLQRMFVIINKAHYILNYPNAEIEDSEAAHWLGECDYVLAQTVWNLTDKERELVLGLRKRLDKKTALKDDKKASKRVQYTGQFVYLLQSPTGAYKIGRTKNPADRLRTFGVLLPFEVEYVCVIETTDMYTLERNLHTKFTDKNINGEWFALTEDDVAYIKGLVK